MDAKRAARIEQLKHTPAWEELAAELEEQAERFWARHIADCKAGKAVDQRELDRAIGKLDGIRALIRAPEKAATIMERQREEETT